MSPEFVVKVNPRTRRPNIKTNPLPGEIEDARIRRLRKAANEAADYLRKDDFANAYGELSKVLPPKIAGALCIAFREGEDGSSVQFGVDDDGEITVQRVDIGLPDKTIK